MKNFTFIVIFLFVTFTYSQDNCNSAIPVTSGNTYTVNSLDGTYNNSCGWSDAADFGEWYSFTANFDGVLNISSNIPSNDPATGDTRLSVFVGNCGALTCYAAADDVNDSIFLTDLTIEIESGTTYYIQWDDRWSVEGFEFEITATQVTCPDGSLPYSEDFSNTNEVIVCYDFVDGDGDGQGWYVVDYDADDDGAADGEPVLASNSWNGNPLNPDNWFISYGIDLTTYTTDDDISLNWSARGVDPDFADENYTVYVSTGNTLNDFTSSSVTFNEIIGQNGGAGVFVDRSLDISSLAGNVIYFAFRHHNVSDEFVLNIDNISIDITLGNEEFKAENIKVSYNENLDELTIKSIDHLLETIELYNILGQKAYIQKIHSNEVRLKLGILQDGIYFAKLSTNGKVLNLNFLKH